MNCITVSASKEYQVKIGNGLLSQIGDFANEISCGDKVAIISDSTVWPLYGKVAVKALTASGFHVVNFTFSAGESSKSIFHKINGKYVALAVTAMGTVMPMIINVYEFEAFLYFIGSVFAPMIAIQIVDYFILNKVPSTKNYEFTSLGMWLVGFVIYRLFMKTGFAVGCTLPAMLVVGVLHIIVQKIRLAGR